jgi:isovaleryl-CoA dehydrogenase
LPENVEEAISAIRRVAADHIAPEASRVDSECVFPSSGLGELGRVGGLGILVPTEFGGIGGGLSDLARACEIVGGACASTGMAYLMHAVAASTIARGGGERSGRYLSKFATGSIGTLAFSERGTGTHFYSSELHAVASNGGVKISGRKSFVTSGGHADIYLVLVQSAAGEGLDCFVVEREADGVRFEGAWRGLGMRGNSSVAMSLSEVVVDQAARIGPPGDGVTLVFSAVAPYFLVGLASVNVGIAAATLEAARQHATNRRYPDGSALCEVQAVQHLLAGMDTAVRTARLLVAEAAQLGDQHDESALVSIMEAKVCATDTAASVAREALEVCGGQGYTPDLPIERHLRDAHAGAVMGPSNSVLRTWIGKAITGLPVP